MKYLVDSMEMRAMDRHSIDTIGIPSIVLMERAALSAVQEMKGRLIGRPSILVFCGTGNNGADGLAMARMLTMDSYPCEIAVIGNVSHATEEWKLQCHICEQMKIPIRYDIPDRAYIIENRFSVLVDAMLGTGLSRLVSGSYEQAIQAMNAADTYRVAVDIPSGISADTGQVLGTAVRADLTVCFQYRKLGTLLFPGRVCSGEVAVTDIGITPQSFDAVSPKAFTMGPEDIADLPARPPRSHKGSFGHVLIMAGSRNMCGAAYLSALAAYRAGAGLVRIYTPEENREILQTRLPEAILTTYTTGVFPVDTLQELCKWADAAVIGPGLCVSEDTRRLVSYMLQYGDFPMVLDADALNIIAADENLKQLLGKNHVLTPHMGEMSRLIAQPVSRISVDMPACARSFSDRFGCVLVLKDACTLVSGGDQLYVNACGNSGMATGGSGDVLSGVIGALLAGGQLTGFEAASYGVLMHALAGDRAAEELGERAVMASDIARRIQ